MTQAQAIKIMMSGRNVFLTGAPGAGKTYTLNKFVEQAEEKGKLVAITASTGIAASHIGGTTIHSWSGMGIAEELKDEDLNYYEYNKRLVKRYKRTDILVIDEISMLHSYRLDMINKLAKHLRKNNRPFGGMQVILVGDMFQLPPVTRGSDLFDFVHHANTWRELNLQICYITEQHRQNSEDVLLALLQAMRKNDMTDAKRSLLKKRISAKVDSDHITRLYSHNVDVDQINQQFLNAIKKKSKHFKMKFDGNPKKVETLQRNILAQQILELKEGAEVMFVANNFSEGFVNGSRGKVVKFANNFPVVQLHNGRKITVERHKWTMKEDGVIVAEVKQIPLRLAWAITIHKSQGMSMDSALVDLSKAFTPGMGYVALSRVRSLEGLFLSGFNDMSLTMHEEIFEFDNLLLKESEK
jgi:ATP-dependent DNA helicase PIF1